MDINDWNSVHILALLDKAFFENIKEVFCEILHILLTCGISDTLLMKSERKTKLHKKNVKKIPLNLPRAAKNFFFSRIIHPK